MPKGRRVSGERNSGLPTFHPAPAGRTPEGVLGQITSRFSLHGFRHNPKDVSGIKA